MCDRTWDVTVNIIVEAETEEEAREQAEMQCGGDAQVIDIEELVEVKGVWKPRDAQS